MNEEALVGRTTSVREAENLLAFGAGALMLVAGLSRRSILGACVALSSAPLFYRGVTGRWPGIFDGRVGADDTKIALAGSRGIHVRQAIRLEVPVALVYRLWRHLDNLPRFMSHLERVTETSDRHSHWVARGPAGLAVEWDAEIINEIENELLAWRSVPGSDIATAGAVNFDAVNDGAETQVSVHLQYEPPAGRAGALFAALFGREPSQTIRADLRRFKRELEAGDMPMAAGEI